MKASRDIVGYAVVLLLFFPFLALFPYLGATTNWSIGGEFWSVVTTTIAQAFASALAAIVFGLFGAFGLNWLARGSRLAGAAQVLALLPNLAPVLVFLLAVLKFCPFARGLGGIVFVHALLNIGVVAIAAYALFRQERLERVAELAWIEGAGSVRFLAQGALPMLMPEITVLFFFVFTLCFASFAVPLMIGGAHASTIEVLIYQRLRLDANWSAAVVLAMLETGILLFLARFVRGGRRAPALSDERISGFHVPLLQCKWGLIVVLAPSVLLLLGLLSDLPAGIGGLLALPQIWQILPSLVLGSFAAAIGSGLLTIAILLLIAWADPQENTRKIFLGLAAPSSVLTGFALLIVWRQFGWASLAKIAIGTTLIAAPALYRWRWDAILQSVKSQRLIAATLGASDGLTFYRIVLPQVLPKAVFVGGLAAFWTWGDFALSSVVAERDLTVALLVKSLMESYRFDSATVLVWLLLFGGIITYLLFQGAGRVLGAKSQA